MHGFPVRTPICHIAPISRIVGCAGVEHLLKSLCFESYALVSFWYSAKRAGVKRACPNKVMARIWFMHDAHLGHAFLFLDMLAEYTLLSMTVMVTPCLWYVVGMKLVCPMSKFPQAPFARAPFGECRFSRE